MSRRLIDWKQVDGWSIANLENSERIDDWSNESGYCVMEQKAMMDVFDGRCAIFGADDARVWSLSTRSETPATS